MASSSKLDSPSANLNHIYFFIDRALSVTAAKVQTKEEITSPTSNSSTQDPSRKSSPGSTKTGTTTEPTTSTSSSQMNPLASVFNPRFADSGIISLPPPPSATQLFELRKTPSKGLALFATARIPLGTLIICEPPLVRISDTSVHSVWGAYCELNNPQKAAFDSLYGYQAENLNFEQASRQFLIDPNDDSSDDEDIEKLVADHVRVMSIFSVNNFHLPPSGLGVFATASRLNHSCVPNVHHSFNPTLNKTTIYAINDIQPGEELCATYLGGEAHYFLRSRRIELLRSGYGFTCDCVACIDCTGASDGRREAMARIAWGLGQFEEGPKSVDPYIPVNNIAALRQAEDLITLMLMEGIQTVELMKAYRAASTQALRLKDYDMALEYAQNEATVERNCMGPEISDLKRNGVAAQCWVEELLRTIKLDKGTEATQKLGGAVMDPVAVKKTKQKQKQKQKKQRTVQLDKVSYSFQAHGANGWSKGQAETGGWNKSDETQGGCTNGRAKEEASQAKCTNSFAEDEVAKAVKW